MEREDGSVKAGDVDDCQRMISWTQPATHTDENEVWAFAVVRSPGTLWFTVDPKFGGNE